MGFLDKFKRVAPDVSSKLKNLTSKDENASEPRERPQREKPTRDKPSREKPVREADRAVPDDDSDDFEMDEFAEDAPNNFADDSAFEFDDDNEDDFFENQQRKLDAEMESYSDLPTVEVRDRRVQDVLEVLEIPETFEIESDVFLPQDIEKVEFDLQTPYGFEQGQVLAFLDQTRTTVSRYVELLTQRNEHIAKLASMVDKLQVNANNLRFQNEIASGVNIMPTSDSDDLENRHMEALLTIRRLEDELRVAKESSDSYSESQSMSEKDRREYDDLQDQVSILRREKSSLQDEVYDLKNRLAYAEEMGEEEPEAVGPSPEEHEILTKLFEEGGEEGFGVLPSQNSKDEFGEEDSGLPSFVDIMSDEDDQAIAAQVSSALPEVSEGLSQLPEVVDVHNVDREIPRPKNSAFSFDFEDDEDPLQAQDDEDELDLSLTHLSEDEDNSSDGADDIDDMLKNWNK